MIDSLLQDIHHPDPQVRGEAIIRLANLRDTAVLPALADVHRNDPDPRLRELALKAGRYVRLNASPADPSSATAAFMSAATPVAQTPASEAAAAAADAEQRQRARNLLDAAAGYHYQDQRARAIESLGRALDLDPALVKDTFALNLAQAVTDLPHDEAIALVRDRDRRAAFIAEIGGKKKLPAAAPEGHDTSGATWGNVTIDLLLYALIAAVSTVAIFLLTMNSLIDLIETLPPAPGSTALTTEELELLTDISLGVLIPFALTSGIYAVIAILIQGAAIHFAAITFFGGAASFVYFLRRFVPFQTAVMLVYAGVFVAISLLLSDIEYLIMLGVAGFVGSIITFVLLSSLLGNVYGFGSGAGCATILIGGLVLGAISFVGTMILSALLGALLNIVA
jgi:hypothetical protein